MADVRQITVAGARVGLADLGRIFKQVTGQFFATDEELGSKLIELVSEVNYIPPPRIEEYTRALLREYKRFQGDDVQDQPPGLEIRVLGPGCPRCHRLMSEVLAILSELQIDADLDHIRDVVQIAQYGLVATPGLAINGKVVSSGRVPSRADITRYLKEASK